MVGRLQAFSFPLSGQPLPPKLPWCLCQSILPVTSHLCPHPKHIHGQSQTPGCPQNPLPALSGAAKPSFPLDVPQESQAVCGHRQWAGSSVSPCHPSSLCDGKLWIFVPLTGESLCLVHGSISPFPVCEPGPTGNVILPRLFPAARGQW